IVAFQVAALTVMGMCVVAITETCATIAALVEFIALQHSAHRTVEDKDALRQSVEQLLHACGVEPGQVVHRCGFFAIKLNTSTCGGRRSRVMRSQLITFKPAFSAKPRSSSVRNPRLR